MNLQDAMACGLYNGDAEATTLGTFIRYPQTASHADELTEADFCGENARAVFRALQGLRAQNAAIDMSTAYEAARALREEAADYAIECARRVPAAANVGAYIAIVRDLARRRALVEIAGQIQRQAIERIDELSGTLDAARQALSELETGRHDAVSIGGVLMNTYERLARLYDGEEKPITTGAADLDAIMGGVFPGELTVIGARPGVGKSAFGMNLAIHAAHAGAQVCVCSREMTDTQYGQRLLAQASGVDGMRMRTGKISDGDWQAISDGMTLLDGLPLTFLFQVRTVEELRIEARRLKEAKQIDVLIVDYLQLMRTSQKFKEDYLRVGYISKALKEIALDLRVSVIALAQVGRSAQGKMPTMAELRSSGEIEQDADGILFLHRPDGPNDRSVDPDDKQFFEMYTQNGYQYMAIDVAKQRQGQTGTVNLLFDPAHMIYSSIERKRR